MTIEILPSGIKCNLSCTYCYQEPMREAGNLGAPLNFIRVKEILEETDQPFTLFGGEPLLTPMWRLEQFFLYGYERYKENSIQTNGLLINDEHIALFKKYNVSVGVSLDGPEGLNSPRCCDADTRTIINNIESLCSNKIGVSLIVTLHQANVGQIEFLLKFFQDMETIGVDSINLHNLEIDNQETEETLSLSTQETYDAFTRIYDFSKRASIPYSPFTDIRSLLTERTPHVSCIWSGCDPLTTPAVHGIAPGGYLANCGRTNKEGIDWMKGDSHSLERYIVLNETLWADGGCRGCQYFHICKGNCPGTAIDGDWRNRSRDCVFWFNLIDYIEQDLRKFSIPVLDHNERNQSFIASLSRPNGQSTQHADVPHGDHTDKEHVYRGIPES